MIETELEAKECVAQIIEWAKKEYGQGETPTGHYKEFIECSLDPEHNRKHSPMDESCYAGEWERDKERERCCYVCGSKNIVRKVEIMEADRYVSEVQELFYNILFSS